MVRATSTGVSAIIDYKGGITARTQSFVEQTLTGRVVPRRGRTPYAAMAERWGDAPILVWSLLLIFGALVMRSRKETKAR